MNTFNIKNSKQKQAIIQYLIALGEGKVVPEDLSDGICYALSERFSSVSKGDGVSIVCDLAMTWKHHSGYNGYPVSEGGEGADICYNGTLNKWNDTPYNNLRKELCLYVAAKLKAMRLEYK